MTLCRLNQTVWTLLVCLSGCGLPHRVPLTKAGAPDYDHVNLVYEFEGPQRVLSNLSQQTDRPIPASYRSGGNRSDAPDDWSAARLSIQFPHPSGNPNLGRATLRLSRTLSGAEEPKLTLRQKLMTGVRPVRLRDFRSARQKPSIGESLSRSESARGAELVRVLDFPKQQLDLLIVDLALSGFFDGQKRQAGGAWLDVHIDRGHTTKIWTPEPRLDDFVDRVFREGKRASTTVQTVADSQFAGQSL